jgi:hypothetical protein
VVGLATRVSLTCSTGRRVSEDVKARVCAQWELTWTLSGSLGQKPGVDVSPAALHWVLEIHVPVFPVLVTVQDLPPVLPPGPPDDDGAGSPVAEGLLLPVALKLGSL